MMAVKVGRPILVGGLGLTLVGALLDGLHHALAQETTALTVVAAIAGVLWLRRQSTPPVVLDAAIPLPKLTRATVEQRLAIVEGAIAQLEQELAAYTATSTSTSTTGATAAPLTNAQAEPFQLAILALRNRLTYLTHDLDRTSLNLAVVGSAGVGKTTLATMLQDHAFPTAITVHDQPAVLTATSTAEQTIAQLDQVLVQTDLTLFVINGDLTSSELEAVKHLTTAQQPVVVALNQHDRYLPDQQITLLQQIRQRLHPLMAAEDVVAIAACPDPIKVRQHQPDGTITETLEHPSPTLEPLTQRLESLVSQTANQLVWGTVLRSAQHLQTQTRDQLNQLRRARALPVVEQFQWIAATTTFLNPVPTMDVLATAAINGQMVIDLGAIYQQTVSLQQAQAVATTLATLMVKLGLVELSTQALNTLLKSNLVTFVVGGTVQGISAAYFTRLAGLTLIDYFESQEPLPDGEASPLHLQRLGQLLQTAFQNQQGTVLRSLVQQGLARLVPQAT